MLLPVLVCVVSLFSLLSNETGKENFQDSGKLKSEKV